MIVGSLVWFYLLFLPSLNAEGASPTLSPTDRLASPGCARRRWSRFPRSRSSAASRFRSAPMSSLSSLFSLTRQPNPLERIQARGVRRRRRRRQAAGFPAVARLGRPSASSRRLWRAISAPQRASRAFAAFFAERGEWPSASDEADAHLIRHAEHLLAAGDRRHHVAPGALAADAPARHVAQVGAETARRRLGRDPVEPRPVAARARPRAPGHHGVRRQSLAHHLEPRVRRTVRTAAARCCGRRRARRNRALQRCARHLWAGLLRRFRRRAHRQPAQRRRSRCGCGFIPRSG